MDCVTVGWPSRVSVVKQADQGEQRWVITLPAHHLVNRPLQTKAETAGLPLGFPVTLVVPNEAG